EPLLLFSGRLVSQKGVETFIDALPEVPAHWQALIAGDGPLRHALMVRARALGVDERVEFLGAVSHEDMSGLYHRAGIVVVPSIWPEPMGMVGPEALAHQRPVVASNVGGIAEWLLDGETGLSAEPGNAHDLARQINRLIGDPE